MSVPIFQIDAFTSVPFRGNPAAVCFPESWPAADWMQSVAAEMNLSETAFAVQQGNEYGLRWFTPRVEVDLCGHATLATAHALWETGRLPESDEARFHTRSGLLTAVRRDDRIRLDFPATPAEPCAPPDGLSDALGSSVRACARARFDLLVEVESAEVVRTLAPDLRRLATLPGRGIIVTAGSDSAGFDFVSRFFAPGSGVDEDPVTGSAHCALGPYWSPRIGKTAMTGLQVSARGGVVRVTLSDGRVLLDGAAVTVLRGRLIDPP